jgi:hypothetical protein
MNRGPNAHAFTAALREAIIQAFYHLQHHVGEETIYAYGLFTNGEGTTILPTANTEESLVRTAQHYHALYGKDVRLYQ